MSIHVRGWSRLFFHAGMSAMTAALTLGVAMGDAVARPRWGSAGCGLGSLVIAPGSGPLQLLAWSGNQTSGSQVFGITSGTSNCVAGSQAQALELQEQFITSNLASVAREMSQGGGETLTAFAATFGCRDQDSARFNAVLKAHAEAILAAPGAIAMLDAVTDHLKDDHELRQTCEHLI